MKNKGRKREPLKLQQLLHLLHRFAIFVCALVYIVCCFNASYDAVGLLRGRATLNLRDSVSSFELVSHYAGTTTVRESTLVKDVLSDSTAPVAGTIYLVSKEEATFTECNQIPAYQLPLFKNAFLRSLFGAIQDGMDYHITEVSTSKMELIAPVVDCATRDVSDSDTTTSRFYFLARDRVNQDNVTIVMLSLSNQQYTVTAQGEDGPAAVATIQLIHDMRQTNVDHHYTVSIGYPFEEFSFRVYDFVETTSEGLWTLQNLPKDDDEIVKTLTTASRNGFYIKAETEQSNINNQRWLIDTDARLIVSRWVWITKPDTHDSWAWVHTVHFFIGMGLLSNLCILLLATYRNFAAGKWWIGDAYVTISTSQIVNGFAVLISWFMNEYWVLHEFSFHTGYQLSEATEILVYEMPMRASLMTMYLSACGVIGTVFKERIDPLFATVCFLVGFESRITILKWFPSLQDYILEYSRSTYMRGVGSALDGQENISPMSSWTTFPIGDRNYTFVLYCLFPVYITLAIVVIEVILHKIYRYFYPVHVRVQRTTTGTHQSENEQSLLSQKRVLTLFEVATGAELENRFGLVSDYETCIFIKGMKFASADGIYSTGFVIANKKYLLQTSDYWSIVLMKLLRPRYKNIYIYEVSGSTVQQRARLVYPHTLTTADLANINVSILS